MQGEERAALRSEREMRREAKVPVDYPPELLEEWRAEQHRLKARLITHHDAEWAYPMPRPAQKQEPKVATEAQKPAQQSTESTWSRRLFAASGTGTAGAVPQQAADPATAVEVEKEPLKLVGGVDISFFRDDKRTAIAALVVLSFPALEVVYELYKVVELTAPYIPGYLAFREVPALLKLIEHVRKNRPEYLPQVLLVDGNGILHYSGFGSACHLGVMSGIPTIGVAKKLLCIDGLVSEVDIDRWMNKCKQLSKEWTEIRGHSGQVHGAMILPRAKAGGSSAEPPAPLYVSVGHRVSLETAVNVTLACIKHTMPDPIDQADLRSRNHVRALDRDCKQKGLKSPTYGLTLEKLPTASTSSASTASSNSSPTPSRSSSASPAARGGAKPASSRGGKQRNARLKPK